MNEDTVEVVTFDPFCVHSPYSRLQPLTYILRLQLTYFALSFHLFFDVKIEETLASGHRNLSQQGKRHKVAKQVGLNN